MLRFLLFSFVLLGFSSVHADDIDIFAYRSSVNSSISSNVLLLVENGASFNANNNEVNGRCGIHTDRTVYTSTAAWTSSGSGRRASNFPATPLDGKNAGVEQCALYRALQSLQSRLAQTNSTMNLAIMLFNKSGTAFNTFNPAANGFYSPKKCISGAGGCLILPMTTFSGANANNILDWIARWDTNGSFDVSGPANLGNGAAFQEAWAYLNAQVGLSGVNYATAFDRIPTTCGKNNIIYLGNNYGSQATPKDSTGSGSDPRVAPVSTNSAYSAPLPQEQIQLKCTPSSALLSVTLQTDLNSGGYALNWAKYLFEQNSTQTVAVAVQGSGCDANYAAHLEKLGNVGGGGFYSGSDPDSIPVAIASAFNKILAVNSSYAAVSLPASTTTQGLFLNQVFIGLFRPSNNFEPRWVGNLKQFKFAQINGVLQLVDADGRPAINTSTGFIDSCARSFWTPTAVDSYWGGGLGSGDCLVYSGDTSKTPAQLELSNAPDGQIVEKGGHAYVLRGGASWGTASPSNRTVYTCTPVPACTARANFNDGNSADVTQTRLGAATPALRTTLINWARGENSKSTEEAQSQSNAPVRSSVHGSVIHSRPVAVNYAATDTETPKVVVFYGANDGMLRAVNGAQTGSTVLGSTTYAAGAELWSFMPPEFFSNIQRLYDNTQTVAFPGTDATSFAAKSYGVDGPVSAYKGVAGNASVVYLFSTLRRGGRVLYAFDVTSPDNPQLLWRKGCPNNFVLTLDASKKVSGRTVNDADCTNDASGDFRDIGQTWSSLKPIKIHSRSNPVLVVSGGYDPCEDVDSGSANHGCTSSAKGRKIYLLDAVTGAILRAFDTARSVVADMAIVTDSARNAIYGYVGDLGGEVYRICFLAGCDADVTKPTSTSAPTDWTITRIASVGCDTPTVSAFTAGTASAGGGYGFPTSACSSPRKLMFAPSVVTTDSSTYLVTFGTGDREKPVEAYSAAMAVANVTVQVRDTPASASWLTDACGLVNAGDARRNVICVGTASAQQSGSSLTRIDPTSIAAPATVSARGWFLPLGAKEQAVTGVTTLFGTVTFSTNQPPSAADSATSCGPSLGRTNVYQINYKDATPVKAGATARFQRVVGDGLPPTSISVGKVLLDPSRPQAAVPFCIGCDSQSPLAGTSPTEVRDINQPKRRLYRYMTR